MKFSQLEMSKFIDLLCWNKADSLLAEVVLSVLMANFKFSLSNQDIFWNLAGVYYPTVGPSSTQPALPLKVEKIAPVI